MRYEAEVHGTVKGTDLTYVLVRYFANDRDTVPTLTEEHLMQLADEGQRVVTNEDGHLLLADGSYLDPAKIELGRDYECVYETFKRDVMAEIGDAVERRWQRAVEKKETGDFTGDASKPGYRDGQPVKQVNRIVETDATDPKGVLARADIEAIKKLRDTKEVSGGR